MLEYLINDNCVCSDDRVAVGVSGGADSMVLLWALLDKQKQIGFHLHIVHVNHHLRGKESDGDALFVKTFCEKKKIAFSVVDVDVKKLKTNNKLTLEEAARIARYEVFAKEMKKEKLNKLFLAHHKNDQVETILMHIFRGAGVAGACGIREDEKIVRPLLDFSKEDLLKIATEHGVKFVVDSSNEDNKYARNYVRNVVLKMIEQVYPNALNSIFEFGKKCKDVQDFIEKSVKNEYFEEIDGEITLKDACFSEHQVVVHATMKKVFSKLGIFADIESKHFDMIVELQKAGVNKSVDLPHGIVAKKTYTGVKFMTKKQAEKITSVQQFVIGEIELDFYGKIKTTLVSPTDVVYGEGALFVDLAKVSNDSVWRVRKLGDVFAKLGTGSKKLNDYFTDKKIETEKRDLIPVLANDNQILVIAERDVSENVKIDGETDQIVKIEFMPNANSWQVN